MKKFIALSAAAVMALTMTGCGKKFAIEGSSSVYSAEDLQNATMCFEEKYLKDNTEVYCQFLGDMSYGDTARYVNMYYYDHDKETSEISGDYLAFRVTTYTAKTPSTVLKAIGENLFDINGFRNSFFGGFEECVVKKDENGEWKYMGALSDIYKFKPDTEDTTADGISDIYPSKEREKALEAMTDSDVWEELDGELLYAEYAGDESASKEELDKLNKSKGTDYDGCMKMHADFYSAEKADIVKDAEWLVARQNGEWEVVEYNIPGKSTAE
ncbi:LptM family lipoprotein [Ruminococcus albus]|uniref:Lipoprotein n=1 Tax=Ruminococcus albus TaxID=1264 RepID=A0A1I1L6N1_RUMAL|nr:hypothetical protein [Ruminococcus albus]SFC68727.1 hypothetical protein SAMN02910406_02170 [Ruminococcus albus]